MTALVFPDSIATERLILRRPKPGDAEAIFAAYATAPQVTRFLTWKPRPDIATTTRDCVVYGMDVG